MALETDELKIGSVVLGTMSSSANFKNVLYNMGQTSYKHALKINTLVHSLYAHDSSGRGGVSSDGSDSRYTLDINFGPEAGINPMLEGIDGTSLYSWAGTGYNTLHPIFYKVGIDPAETRPNTIYETFLSLLDWTQESIDTIRTLEVTGDNCITNCSYTKGYIGAEAFASGATNSYGSMISRLERTESKIEQLKNETIGDTFSLADDSVVTSSLWSLSQKVDALLDLHGGGEYTLDQIVSPLTPIVLTAETQSQKVTRFLDIESCEAMYLDSSGNARDLNRTRSYVFNPSTLTTYASNPVNTAPLFARPNGLDVLIFDPSYNGEARHTILRWSINLNSIMEKAQSQDGAYSEEGWTDYSIEDQVSDFEINNAFSLSVIYDWTGGEAINLPIDNTDHVEQFWELTLYAQQESDENPIVAKTTGSLGSLANSPFTESSTTDNISSRLRSGIQKINLISNSTLGSLAWRDGLGTENFILDNSHRITMATLTLVHKAGTEMETQQIVSSSSYQDIYGNLKVLGAEMQWTRSL